jgi:hypothetical protein
MGSIHGLEIDQSFPLESTILPQQIPALSKKDKKTSRATAVSILSPLSEGHLMNKLGVFTIYTFLAVTLAGCSAATIKPNYTTTHTDLIRIGGDAPQNKDPEILNTGSFCLQVIDKWKTDGKTPDGQAIWTKDSFRKVVPCRKE